MTPRLFGVDCLSEGREGSSANQARRPAGAPGATGGAALTAWFCYALTTVVLALGVTWALYAQADYGYAFW